MTQPVPIRFPVPMTSGPTRWTCGPISQSGPIATGPSTTVYGPMRTPGETVASGETTAVEWICDTCRVSWKSVSTRIRRLRPEFLARRPPGNHPNPGPTPYTYGQQLIRPNGAGYGRCDSRAALCLPG